MSEPNEAWHCWYSYNSWTLGMYPLHGPWQPCTCHWGILYGLRNMSWMPINDLCDHRYETFFACWVFNGNMLDFVPITFCMPHNHTVLAAIHNFAFFHQWSKWAVGTGKHLPSHVVGDGNHGFNRHTCNTFWWPSQLAQLLRMNIHLHQWWSSLHAICTDGGILPTLTSTYWTMHTNELTGWLLP